MSTARLDRPAERTRRLRAAQWCKREDVYLDKSLDDEAEQPKPRKCHLKGGKPGMEAQYSIVSVTLALGRQLLAERAKSAA